MGLVRVINQNVHPFTQEFRGEKISLAAKGKGKNFIDMEHDDAILFVGQFSPVKMDYDNKPLPESYKMLDIVPLDGQPEEMEEKFICQQCRQEFSSQEELDAHITESHLDLLADEDERDKRRKGGRPRKGSYDGSSVPAT